ncbi:CaiB/BaiF CoA transferase family protein [Nocardioides sp. DS6]|uniref:CaiB/BaiF CoA transferase family protein n=1 Tax=Nocardioides eburneus TaxID=3231482 RepID=A0ABV3SZN8_9ACTN
MAGQVTVSGTTPARPGPLAGLRVVELGGIGPGPFCAMVLADLGADVVRVHRPSEVGTPPNPVLDRGRRTLAIDLKRASGVAVVRRLIDESDVLLEGFRPGVLERLGLAPEVLRASHPELVVGRMTGFGQEGPLAARAGHDINYIALSGVLGSIGRPGERPVPPLNLVGDFGGGGMLLALGVVSAVLHARTSGVGQDVDAAMVDGSALLMAMTYGFAAQGRWTADRGSNMFDGSMPFYDTYECADAKYVAVGAVEPQFYRVLVETLGVTDLVDVNDPAAQRDPATFPATRKAFAEAFATRTRDEWAAVFAEVDACVTPVLDIDEAPSDAHLVDRATYVHDENGVVHPAPAPRFGATPLAPPAAPAAPGAHTHEILAGLGLTTDEIAALHEEGTVA